MSPQPWLWQDSPCYWHTSSYVFYLWVPTLLTLDVFGCKRQEEVCVSVTLAAFSRNTSNSWIGFNSRFCSGEKFLFGFRDLFFCLFLDSVSPVVSESSNALFWQTVFFTSDVWLFPLASGSFGLLVTKHRSALRWGKLVQVGRSCCSSLSVTLDDFAAVMGKKGTTKSSDSQRSDVGLTDPVGERQLSLPFSFCSSGDLLLHNHGDSC